MCYSKLTHTNMHLAFKHSICLTLIHNIKLYHSSNNIYPRTASISQYSSINKAFTWSTFIMFINQGSSPCSSTKSNAYSCNYAWLTSLTSYHHSTCVLMHVDIFICVFFFFDKLQFINQKTEKIRGASSLQTSTKLGGRLPKLN